MKNPIYQPSGAAKEYGDLALNIYTGCPHRCYYCFAPQVLHRDRELFHSDVRPRDGIVEAVKEQLEQPHIREKLIHLCFSCDPYPRGYDSSETREIIKLLKESGNHVQILTKSGRDCLRDFDLLDNKDWFGVTVSCGYNMSRTAEPNTDSPPVRLDALHEAKQRGINTWVTYYISADDSANASTIQTAVTAAVADFNTWTQSKLGRAINPDELTSRIKAAGADRAVITSPAYTAVSSGSVAVVSAVSVTYGGLE